LIQFLLFDLRFAFFQAQPSPPSLPNLSTMNTKRPVDLVVISDVHLGTYGCHAKELSSYLKSIEPKLLVLNGDIIDIWQFNKRYWPKSHMKVIKQITSLMSKGTEVKYVTGNHDEMLRKFAGFEMSSFSIVNKLRLPLEDGDAWIFHGDVFDVTMQHSKWLAKLGAFGYDMLILLNRAVNFISEKMGRGRISLSKKIKNSVKGAVSFINNFERLVVDLAAENGFKYVVCGHIHQPQIKTVNTLHGEVTYLNSGDWIENLTALEYHEGEWSLYRHQDEVSEVETEIDMELTTQVLFQNLVAEFKLAQ
jgi:UDP-2,3-diacylglucosamine pyrophosphatase LpxH